MAKKYPGWNDLNPAQKKLALKKWHQQRNGGDGKPDPLAREVAPGLTERELRRNVKAATGLKYGQVTQQLAGQPARTNDWYQQYRQAIEQARIQQQKDYLAATQGVSNLQQNLNTQAQQAWAGEQAAMAADAANRGATTDPTLAAQAHNAANVRGILTNSFGAMLATQGTAANKDLLNRKVSAGQQRVADLGRIETQRQQLSREKGQFRQTYRSEAISDASKQALNNALTASTLGDRAASTEKTQAETAQTRAETAFFKKYGYKPSAMSPKDAAALAYFRKHNEWPRTTPQPDRSNNSDNPTGKDQYGYTRKDRERYHNQWQQAQHIAGIIGKKAGFQTIYDGITAKSSTIPDWMARAAAQQLALGYVGPNIAKQLKRHSIKNGWNRPKGATGVTGGTNASGG